ncbi:MAG: hypothetical protein EXS31_06415 [Pedosphaera sp.]|nr:hypothetical protein [Pedosphaera sp.]
MTTNRRQFIASTAAAVALAKFAPLFAAEARPRFKIGACDWSIGKMADPAALEVAKQIGLACKIHSGLVGRKFWRKISRERWFECW